MRKIGQILVCVLIVVLLCLNIFQGVRYNNAVRKGDILSTDTLKVYDTVRVEIPVPKEEKPLGIVAVKLPVSAPKTLKSEPKSPKTHEIEKDSVANFSKSVPGTDDKEDNFPNKSEPLSELAKLDSVSVQIPIMQRVYETSQYRAVVSGYQPSLDDLLIYQPSQVVRIRDKPKRWGVGIQVGYGFSPTSGNIRASPYIGIGVSYNLFTW